MRASHMEQDRTILGTTALEMFTDSETPHIDYFRDYALPQLETLNKVYVAVRTYPTTKDSTPPFTAEDLAGLSEEEIAIKIEPWNRIDQRSILVKKSDYDKLSTEKLLALCKKYVDYIPESYDVIELLHSNLEGGDLQYSEFRANESGELTKQLSDTYSVRSQLSLLKDKDRKKSDKK